MRLSFKGSADELAKLIANNNVRGVWKIRPHGVRALETLDGAVMNWSETKRTIWCQGNAEAARRLEAKLEAVLLRRLTGGLRSLF